VTALDFNDKKVTFERFVSPVGVAVFPRLNEPDFKFEADGMYSVKLALEGPAATELINMLQARIEAAHEFYLEEVRKKRPATQELKLADPSFSPEVDDKGARTGRTLFNFKRKAKVTSKSGKVYEFSPALFDSHRDPLPSDTLVYGGSRIKVSFQAPPFYVASLGVGVKLQLAGVQVLELKTRGELTAQQLGFEKEEGYVAGSASSEPEGEEKQESGASEPEGEEKQESGAAADF
jgi:Single-stranded DNA-binding protein, Bacteriophage T7